MADNPYSLVSLWSQGDVIIKGVVVLLLLMSIASWYVIVTRLLRVFRLRHATRATDSFWSMHSFDEGLEVLDTGILENPFRKMVLDAQAAREHHASGAEDFRAHVSLSDWLSGSLRASIDDSVERMQSGLPVLASVGSTAPFIGLFGTVWGIYRALVSIGASGHASIGLVAGPVGEALIMTAFGLAVAVPAVVGYNALLRANRRVAARLQRFARQLHICFLTESPLVTVRSGPDTKEKEDF